MSTGERSKAAVSESAFIRKVEKALPAITPGWYLYKGQAVFVFHHDNALTVRGYDFDTKTEWRTLVGNLDATLLQRLEVA